MAVWLKVFKLIVWFWTFAERNVQAFWWSAPTTQSPNTVLKHIPLTYYRTYTYQPLYGGGMSFPPHSPFPYFASHPALALPSPQLSPPSSMTAVAPILSGGRYDVLPPSPSFANQFGAPVSALKVTPKTTPKTTTSTTTTTTTTSTTPAPRTTPTTTTARAIRTNNVNGISYKPHTIEPLINAEFLHYHNNNHENNNEYPTYNRRLYNSGNYRRHYPYPEYYNQPNDDAFTLLKRPTRIGGGGGVQGDAKMQFVPCLCPVSVQRGTSGSGGDNSGERRSGIYYTQSRHANEADDNIDDMQLPSDNDDHDDEAAVDAEDERTSIDQQLQSAINESNIHQMQTTMDKAKLSNSANDDNEQFYNGSTAKRDEKVVQQLAQT